VWSNAQMLRIIVLLLPALLAGQTFDIVIDHGRVIDPESRLDAVRNIGVSKGRVAAVTSRRLQGKLRIDASRLVVAPGFIDLHEHMQSSEAYELKALDGVTTALELEAGAAQTSPDRWTTADIATWYAEREGKSSINFGASAGHMRVRMAEMGDTGRVFPEDAAVKELASHDQVSRIEAALRKGLQQGALGLGLEIAYVPAQRLESMVQEMRRKGRIRVGADADLAIFDPDTVIDKATYEHPKEPSVGFRFVLVGGEVLVQEGKLKQGVRNGQGIRAHR